ncbi:alpha/beta fold hydrolase [Nocardia macrotermitis]|uniref:4,5:9,10-diseco-3-hydroxy-5,9, 17-trioxoandrosta-1(10),2-diene-4-oate hydrolase n=1 Tax=Nocardia macrotermitis TaxID=2585198 RepID=A0A7K0D743_9NOCA|nr:alpha/beta fold hydrolase [Nocardia macrotermitis]MQY21576.1 4,5:9,10-diseco-3-hydroxy-5,9,17-trioxoandrosta-1(10),2-diene-4-oate hydrolase [Nocardia macrotermitis]
MTATAELTYESTRATVEIDGLTLNYHEAGTGEPLIMLHGSGPGVSAWTNFRHNLPVFADRFRTIMPDMPGFGASELPELGEVYTLAAARWIARLMDHLGIETVSLIGNSMGGAVAAELAALYPERVRRIAIMGSGGLSVGIFGAEPSEGFKRLFEFLETPSRAGMIAWIETMVSNRELITEELVDERMANATAEGVIPRMKQIFGSMFDPARRANYTPLWTRAQSFTTPTLMLWGRDDRMLPYDGAHVANRLLPEVELHTFARCGHWIQVERKAEFERVAIEFLTRDSAA